MKLSKAEVRRRLSPGTQFTGEFIGQNAKFCAPGMEVCRREVQTNSTHQLISKLLDGPKVGESIYLQWSNVVAREENSAIILSDEGDDFLKITERTNMEKSEIEGLAIALLSDDQGINEKAYDLLSGLLVAAGSNITQFVKATEGRFYLPEGWEELTHTLALQ